MFQNFKAMPSMTSLGTTLRRRNSSIESFTCTSTPSALSPPSLPSSPPPPSRLKSKHKRGTSSISSFASLSSIKSLPSIRMPSTKQGKSKKTQLVISEPVQVITAGNYAGPLHAIKNTEAPARRGDQPPKRPVRQLSVKGPGSKSGTRRKSSVARGHATAAYKSLYPKVEIGGEATSRRSSTLRTSAVADYERKESVCGNAMAEMRLDLERWVLTATAGTKAPNDDSPTIPAGLGSINHNKSGEMFGNYSIGAGDDRGESPILPSGLGGKYNSMLPVDPHEPLQQEYGTWPRTAQHDDCDDLIDAIETELRLNGFKLGYEGDLVEEDVIDRNSGSTAKSSFRRSSSVYSDDSNSASSWTSHYSSDPDADRPASPAVEVKDQRDSFQTQEIAALAWQTLWGGKMKVQTDEKTLLAAADAAYPKTPVSPLLITKNASKRLSIRQIHDQWPARQASQQARIMNTNKMAPARGLRKPAQAAGGLRTSVTGKRLSNGVVNNSYNIEYIMAHYGAGSDNFI